MSSHVITPGPYRATKLWNEVTRLFRSGMPLRKHRLHFRVHAACFTASAAVDWLHGLLCSNSNFGPDVTRQQTLQLLKKFLKNHVIEDVKGRFGTEDFEDGNILYRFPTTSPLKAIPCPAPTPATSSIKKRLSIRDKDGFFRFKSINKHDKETQENVDPAVQAQEEASQPATEKPAQQRVLTEEDEQELWRDITLTHLQKILGLTSLDDVLDQRHVNPQNIIHNVTRVNKHGVVTLDDKTNDLPHWVLSAMKSLANWPKYDSGQPSYPGFERDVFKTVSDYFYSLPQPLLTYQLYELFINILVLCGYVTAPPRHQRAKRKLSDPPSLPPPAKAPFHSTECLLLSLLRQGSCDETDSPMKEVFSTAVRSRLHVLNGEASTDNRQFGGSCLSLNQSQRLAGPAARRRPRSCSLVDTVLDDSAPFSQQLLLSNDSLAVVKDLKDSLDDDDAAAAATLTTRFPLSSTNDPTRGHGSVGSTAAPAMSFTWKSRLLRPRSMGSCLDIVVETREDGAMETTRGQSRAASCLNVNVPEDQLHSSSSSSHPPSSRPSSLSSSHASSSSSSYPSSSPSHPSSSSPPSVAAKAPRCGATRPLSSTSSLWTLRSAAPPSSGPALGRRTRSSLDVSKLSRRPVSLFKPPLCLSTSCSRLTQSNPENRLLKPQCERVAIEALQLCTLLLPPASRRRLQLLMRMMSRISQNVDMPRLHHAIGTRTLMVHTFSACVLGSAEECDLDELLATRLVSFLMDHQQSILSVPDYLVRAVTDHVQYLRTAQLPAGTDAKDRDLSGGPMLLHAFCRQISTVEFEEQRVTSSQKAMVELLEMLLSDQNITEKDRRKKLKQFQKQYPDIYSRRFPGSERDDKKDSKPKIKAPLLTMKKTKVFSIRN